MRRFIEKVVRDEKGQAAVLVALMVVVLMGLAASVIDIGAVRLSRAKMQSAADAAALAGAQHLPSSDQQNKNKAIGAAKDLARSNGVGTEEDITINTPYKDDSSKIEVICRQNVQYTLARVLGFTDADVLARAVAEKKAGEPFDFAIFAGGDSTSAKVAFSGDDLTVNGNVHSNSTCHIADRRVNIPGTCQASESITVSACHEWEKHNIGKIISPVVQGGSEYNPILAPVPRIDMPDFSDLIQAAGIVQPGDKNIGNDAGEAVLAAGNIYINGNYLTFSGSNSVCLYSENGNIDIRGDNITLHGLVYAPEGQIDISGSNITVYGRIIGKTVNISGNDIEVSPKADDLDDFARGGVKLVE